MNLPLLSEVIRNELLKFAYQLMKIIICIVLLSLNREKRKLYPVCLQLDI